MLSLVRDSIVLTRGKNLRDNISRSEEVQSQIVETEVKQICEELDGI
jgi:hypothetical protein